MKTRLIPVVTAIALSAGVAGCGGGGGNSNLTPTAVATPTPAPTPAPSPTPSATPTPSPASFSCPLPPRDDCSAPEGPAGVFGCCRQRGDELGEFVYLASRDVQAARPELFDGDRLRNGLQDTELIQQLIVRQLGVRFGLCAKITSDDEIAVKRNNDTSEQYDVFIGDGAALNVYGYILTCKPARF